MKRKPFTRGLTTCWRGHAFTPENTYARPDGSRNCRTCKNKIMRDWVARLKARRAVAAVLLLLISAPAHAQVIGKSPYLVLLAGESADLATTLHGLHGGRAKEGNAVMATVGTPGLIAMKVAGAVFIGWAMKKVGAEGHPKVAKALGYVTGIALAGVSIHNVRVSR